MYIAPKSTKESRAHYAPPAARTEQNTSDHSSIDPVTILLPPRHTRQSQLGRIRNRLVWKQECNSKDGESGDRQTDSNLTRDAESLFFCGTPTPNLALNNRGLRLRLQDVMCNRRCTSVHNTVQARPARIVHRPKPRTNILSSMYSQGVGLRTRSRGLPQKEDSDSNSRPKPELRGTPDSTPLHLTG